VTEPPRPPRLPRGQIVRLACRCGRNLADVRPIFGQAPEGADPAIWDEQEHERVFPVPRPGVRQSDYAHRGGGPHTFRWDCRCGRTWQVRGERIEAIWREHAESGRVVRLTLGQDVM
jgi:hypothetical protein